MTLGFLFVAYEACGIVTNLLGGRLGQRYGLDRTLHLGLWLQVAALFALSMTEPTWAEAVSIAWVIGCQGLSGVAKDLTKMSSKSAVKLLVQTSDHDPSASERKLFKWVAILTGSKNALKGVGFLLGGVLLGWIGFAPSLWAMAGGLTLILIAGLIWLKQDLGKSKQKVKFSQLFSKSREINILSAARFFLFASRDIWFVVGLPIFLKVTLGWSFASVGGFMAAWVMGYGLVQASAPAFVRRGGAAAGAWTALIWGILLVVVTAAIAAAVHFDYYPRIAILCGLAIFGIVFAVNSAVHSYLILAYTDSDKVALNVGFYYMANACGRLVGTLLSGVLYLRAGLSGCLWTSTGFVFMAAILTIMLPKKLTPPVSDA